MLIKIFNERMIAKRFAFPCSRRRANGIAEKASQPKMIANQMMYSGCPENLSVSEIGVANKKAINTNETEEINKEINAEA